MQLLIPIEILTENNSNLDSDLSSAQTSSLDSKEIVHFSSNFNDIGKIPSFHSLNFDNKKSKSSKSPNKSLSLCDSHNNNSFTEESIADFLIRIDSSIARTKNQVEKMSKKIDENSFEQEFDASSRRFNTPKLVPSERNITSSSTSLFPFDSDGNLPCVAMSNNNRKKVKSSLKRFEKSHEEIFEL